MAGNISNSKEGENNGRIRPRKHAHSIQKNRDLNEVEFPDPKTPTNKQAETIKHLGTELSGNLRAENSSILTKEQAAKFLGVSERTLSRLHYEGKGPPFVRIGRQVRYLHASLLAWLKAHETRPVRA